MSDNVGREMGYQLYAEGQAALQRDVREVLGHQSVVLMLGESTLPLAEADDTEHQLLQEIKASLSSEATRVAIGEPLGECIQSDLEWMRFSCDARVHRIRFPLETKLTMVNSSLVVAGEAWLGAIGIHATTGGRLDDDEIFEQW